MNGWDTNVLLRLFTADSPEQSAAVARLLDGCGPASIRLTNIVLAEFVWTLSRSYKRDKREIADVLELMLQREEFVFENRSALMTAIHWFGKGNADFADYLIAALNDEAGASPTYTFDRSAAAFPVFALVPP
ncbi:MAG: type II toxin-antitoxin system VapC family toxin [Rhodoplanes sp.]|uniref:PIN domain-containing protein n=1 Tax=Rhodoplanes sp. TaxID=1968906 RepID=UPI00184DF008|nr:type II toxin-antitoxin system VapC family toxin [Rhodoplanes sp.]NVO13299.1 type II toxin-antitoxin system VapC family toxin [Rhodoplanes sp.]